MVITRHMQLLNCIQSERRPVMEELQHQLHVHDTHASQEPASAGALPGQVQLLKGEVGSRPCGSWYIPAPLVALAPALHAGLFSSLPDCPHVMAELPHRASPPCQHGQSSLPLSSYKLSS